jgi:hypothetical protein
MKRTTLLFVALLVFGGTGAFACPVCVGHGPACEATADMKAVFTGRVLRIEKDVVVFSVYRVFHGPATTLLRVHQGQSDCEFVFVVGEDYLVFALSGGLILDAPSICSGTTLLSEGGEALEYLEQLERAPTRVFGHVDASPTIDGVPEVPLHGTVRLSGDGRQFEATIEPSGDFEIADLPAGDYRGSITLPDRYFPQSDFKVRVAPHGCRELRFPAQVGGGVRGTVLDLGGNPVALVSLVLARRDERGEWSSAMNTLSDWDGNFELGPVDPGLYILAVTDWHHRELVFFAKGE